MSRLEEINGVKTLQQVASHLEKSTIRLSKENASLRAQVARLKGQVADPQLELDLLKEQLAALQRMAFGESSERSPKDLTSADEPKTSPRGHGPKSQPNLPVEEVKHTLEEEDRACSICGEILTEMGDQAEESEEITVVGVEYKILKHRRQKYRRRCNEQVMTAPAPAPAKLIPGGRYSVDFAVHVAEQGWISTARRSGIRSTCSPATSSRPIVPCAGGSSNPTWSMPMRPSGETTKTKTPASGGRGVWPRTKSPLTAY